MLYIYNTISGKKEIFKPLKNKKVHPVKSARGGVSPKAKQFNRVNLFVCGITPYDYSHIGHARTYIIFDMVAKYLREKRYDVFYLQNITDVDDKIINRAIEEKIFWKDLSRKFEREYLKDMKSLNVNSVTKYARATAHIKEIISQVERLLEKGYAYRIKDGIYYDISKFKNYGRLSGRTAFQAEDGVSRIDEAREKRNKGDFCLWKFSKPNEPSWEWPAPKGRGSPRHMAGRPGWHIEDTAIAEKFFGPQYDIHGGGRDLIFPHHEAEIAQMEAISGKKPLVKYWIHTGFLTVKGAKMAKSIGNFVTIRDFINKHSPRILRFLILKNHYRSPIDYTDSAVLQTKRELEKIDEFVEKLKTAKELSSFQKQKEFSSFIRKGFWEAMEDDFNTPKAMASIFEIVSQGNFLIDRNLLNQADVRNILEFLKKIDRFFAFIFWKKPKEKIPSELLSLAKQRQKYREQGNWQKADEIRRKIKEMGCLVEDTKEGSKIKKIKK